jgi:hypothetical protein
MKPETKKFLSNLNHEFYLKAWSNWNPNMDEFFDGWKKSKEVLIAKFINNIFPDKIINYIAIDFHFPQSALTHNSIKNITKIEFDFLLSSPHEYSNLATQLKNLNDINIVVSFGLLHHLACIDTRIMFFNLINSILNTNSIIHFSTFQFLDNKRLKKKAEKNPYNLLVPKYVQDELEEFDYFLNGGERNKNYRYSHYYTDEEIRNLIEQIQDFSIFESYTTDGKYEDTNRYFLLKSQ